MKQLPNDIRSLVNRAAHAAGLAHEARMRVALLSALQALADAGAPATELRALVAQQTEKDTL